MRIENVRNFPVAVAAIIFALPAAAEMTPLSEILTRPPDRIEVGYPWIRCAALYTGIERYAGVNLGPDLLESSRKAAERSLIFAAMLRVQKAEERGFGELDVQKQVDHAITEMEPIMLEYVDRFRANFAAQGSFMDGDQMSMQDYSLCAEMRSVVLGE
ncbi:hypothetical protein FA743_07665 [Paracoccus gahaiensis]|uniref:Uncharacterized protein n=1 Tax=Paracoccus gahaiensis TaxID=1706839 RepID=A0A4U0RA81_9RHOB|nr:hypothetical protein [Paracoccus gahaiensis]TJZ92133.1 hypothetical protein FA743_07665 [Paracoccus gahaiensis]